MTPPRPMTVALRCHPSTPTDVVRSIEVQVSAADAGTLNLAYALDADMSRVRTPRARSPRRADGLWKRTCFEAFLCGAEAPAYYELNIAPSAQWALYRFEAYRNGATSPTHVAAPGIVVRHAGGRLELETSFHFDSLPELRSGTGFRLALAAVIEDADGRLSFWALAHAGERPDFHQHQGFLLEVGPDRLAWASGAARQGIA